MLGAMYDYDLVVIGSGPAGEKGAVQAAYFGKRVAVIERSPALAPFTSTHVEVAHGLLAVDRFALFFKIIFLGSAAITTLISMKYLEIEGVSPGEYYFLILCSTLGMMVMAAGIAMAASSAASGR